MGKDTITIPAPPKGFVLEDNIPSPPDGFVLEQPYSARALSGLVPQPPRIEDPQALDLNILPRSTEDSSLGITDQFKQFGKALAYKPERAIPFSPVGAVETIKVAESAKRLQGFDYGDSEESIRKKYPNALPSSYPSLLNNAKALKNQDIKIVEKYFEDLAKREKLQKSFGGRVGLITQQMPAFMIEFMMTGGLQKLGSTGAKNMGIKLLGDYAKTKAGKTALATGGFAIGTALRSAGMPNRLVEAIESRQLPQDFKIKKDGSVEIKGSKEGLWTSIWKGAADHYIEIASEQAGEAAPAIGKWLSPKISSRLPFMGKFLGGLQRQWLRLHQNKKAADFIKAISNRVGYHGVLNEIGEEYIGDLSRAALNVDKFTDIKDPKIHQRLSAAFMQDTKMLPEMAVSFALPGAARMVTEVISGQYLIDREKESALAEQRLRYQDVLRREISGRYDVGEEVPPISEAVREPSQPPLAEGAQRLKEGEPTGPIRLEEAQRRAEEKLKRKVTKVKTGKAEGPLVAQLYTQMEELLEQAQAETDPAKRNAILDRMEKIDNVIGQLDRTNLETKDLTQLQKMAKRFGIEVPKGAEKEDIINLMAGRADLSQIEKTPTGYQIKVPIAETKAGRGWEIHEFDNFAEAVDFLEEREAEKPARIIRPESAPISEPKTQSGQESAQIRAEEPAPRRLEEVEEEAPAEAPAETGEVITKPKKKISAKIEFKVGDVLDTKGNTNMADPIKIREVKGNTLKFTDAEGVEYSGMPRATVMKLIEGGSWERLTPEVKAAEEEVPKAKVEPGIGALPGMEQEVRETARKQIWPMVKDFLYEEEEVTPEQIIGDRAINYWESIKDKYEKAESVLRDPDATGIEIEKADLEKVALREELFNRLDFIKKEKEEKPKEGEEPPEEKPKGGAGGASVAAVSAKAGGYGTIASSEKSTFVKNTERKRFRDAAPDKSGLDVVDELMKGVSPATREGAREAARVLRKDTGRLAQETEVAHKTLRKAHHAFTFMSRKDVYEFIDRMEKGENQGTLKLNQIAKSMREMLDGRREMVRALGKGHLENFYENYFPHIWKDPSKARNVILQIFGKRKLEGTKSFLKKRTIMTIKEGREYGLELVRENPVDLVLLKVFEMDRYIMAQRIIQDLKARGLIKFVYKSITGGRKTPDGYIRINDNAFTVYMPPEITKKEAYDQLLVDQMMDVARSLGIDTQRFVNIGGSGRWGYASPFPEKVRTKYAGPESVLIHEIGHVLGFRYNLYEVLGRRMEGEWKVHEKGKHKGEKYFAHAKKAVEHRRTIDKEWRDLADARYKGQKVGPGFKGYVRKRAEKEAVLLEALIHAPDEFKRVAPTLYDLFTKFLNNHSELRPLLDIKPSLVLGTSDAKIAIPGFTTLGHYYAPEPVAKLVNNYLSPGLRNSDNKLIAGGYNIIRMAGNILNQAQLAISGFHGINVTTDMIASTIGQGLRQLDIKGQRINGIGKIITSPTAPISRLWMGIRLRRAYKKQIDTIENQRLRTLVKAVVLAGGRDRMDPFYYNQAIKALTKTFGDIIHGSPAQKISGTFRLPFEAFGATLEALAKPLMEWYVPTGKLGLFAMIAESEMKRAEEGQINNEQLHEQLVRSWDSVDNRMGQLVLDNLFWNKFLRDIAAMGVRSVGWNLGSWREYGGVPIDILTTKGRLARGDVLLSQKMAYTIGAITLYAAIAAVVGYILTGKTPEEPEDYFFPKTGKKNPDGSDERLSMPTYAKDWFAYGTQPFQTVKNKLHPIWGVLTDVVSNRDFFNTQIRDPKDPVSKQLYDTMEYIAKESLPISVKNYHKMTKAAPGQTQRNAWVSITGITSAPSYITRSPAQKLMYRYIVENIPDKPKTKEKAERNEYLRNIKNRLRKGDPVNQSEVIKKIGRRSWVELKKDVQKEPFAEAFERLSLEQALNVYAIADKSERQKARIILRRKYKNAQKRTPEMRQLYFELINK